MNLNWWTTDYLLSQLVELGYRGGRTVITREAFEARRRAHIQETAAAANLTSDATEAANFDLDRNFADSPFLARLAERVEDLESGRLTTILFLRDKNSKVGPIVYWNIFPLKHHPFTTGSGSVSLHWFGGPIASRGHQSCPESLVSSPYNFPFIISIPF